MDADLRWVVGVAVTIVLALIGTIVTMFRALGARIHAGDRELSARIEDTRDNYVRRDDQARDIARIENNIAEMRKEIKEQNEKILEAVKNGRR